MDFRDWPPLSPRVRPELNWTGTPFCCTHACSQPRCVSLHVQSGSSSGISAAHGLGTVPKGGRRRDHTTRRPFPAQDHGVVLSLSPALPLPFPCPPFFPSGGWSVAQIRCRCSPSHISHAPSNRQGREGKGREGQQKGRIAVARLASLRGGVAAAVPPLPGVRGKGRNVQQCCRNCN